MIGYFVIYLVPTFSSNKPRSYNETSKHSCWQQAMQDELSALASNNTWQLALLPLEKRPIGCKWVYKSEHKFDGILERHKTCLVFHEIEGLDFLDTFALVAKLTTLRLLLVVVTSQNWFLKQLDINNSFLHGDLNKEVYITPPLDLSIPSPQHVCKLQHSLYDLCQLGRQWYSKLSQFLLDNNFVLSSINHLLFIKYNVHSITNALDHNF